MGIPVVITSNTTRAQAISNIILSVALEQTALANILKAESEKNQKIVALSTTTPELLFAINSSVICMANAITKLEMVLGTKLELLSNRY